MSKAVSVLHVYMKIGLFYICISSWAIFNLLLNIPLKFSRDIKLSILFIG